MSKSEEWWKGAVIYQVYPRSFADADNDGIGDIPGITDKLDYIASLGVDAIWLSPFFKSPMKDYGYDVSDYRDVDPMFGTMDDFKKMMAKAHSLGLKIIIDMVLSHSSDQHPWFAESRSSRTNPKADWYVWADPKPDGGPPNNWLAHFGGSSWTYEVRRGQYYLHNFLAEQPDLNLYKPEVRAALFDMMRFWLDMGVDGFRLDAIGCFFHSPKLEDNPVNPNPVPSFSNFDFPTPHNMQDHKNDFLIEPGVQFCREIRSLLDEYEGRMAVAEVGGEDCITRAPRYTAGPDLLHTSYNFGLLGGTRASAAHIARVIGEFLAQPGGAWPSWALTNHDVVRVASRWFADKSPYAHDPRFSKMLMAMLCSLQGAVFIYEGEELGLPESCLTFDQIQDPWGKYLYPQWQGRDGCRTPMPWANKKNGGFSKTAPWLPVPEEHCKMAVGVQEKDKGSTLNFTRRFLKWRKENPALVTGKIEFIDLHDDGLLGFKRVQDDEEILCLFNLSDREHIVPLRGTGIPFDSGDQTGKAEGSVITLPPYGIYVG